MLYEDEDFRLEHSCGYRIAGLVFVNVKADARRVSELPRRTLRRLGPVLSGVERAVAEVMSAENVYVARFGESGGPIHFHVFPRTASLTEAWRVAGGATESVDAPALMSWANKTYVRDAFFGDIPLAVERLKERIADDVDRAAGLDAVP